MELPPAKFELLRGIFEGEFNSDPPDKDHARVFVCVDDDGEPVGFVHAEVAIILGQLYVVPSRRNSTLSITQSLLSFLRKRFDGKATVAAVASEPRFEKLFESYGMQKIPGTFHRKNADF